MSEWVHVKCTVRFLAEWCKFIFKIEVPFAKLIEVFVHFMGDIMKQSKQAKLP